MNDENLIPFKKGDQRQKDLGRIGGKKGKGRFKIIKKRICDARCPLFGRCIYQPLSKTKFKGRCALANSGINERNKERYIKTLIGNQDNFIENLKDLLAELDLKSRATSDFHEIRKLIYDYINVYKTIYGIRLNQDITATQDITITDIELKIKELISGGRNEDNKKEN